MQSGRSLAGFWALAVCALLWAGGAKADPVEDFYKGKSISLIIGLGEGGGYDLSARLVAQHLGDFIPGHPTIVPRNMPGAGSIAAAEYAYSVAPRDGTTLLVVQPTFVLEKISNPARKFESEKFTYIGRVDQSILVGLVWHSSPAQSIEDLKRMPISVSANGAAGTSATIPWALNRMIGTKMRVVLGYDSTATMGLAMERGETDGNGSTSWDYLETKHEWFDEKMINILYTIALTRFSKIPDVPTILELTDNARDRNALKLIASTSTIGRALMSTPGVPVERVEALRRAFDRMVKDPQFLADAATRRLGVDPLSGEELQKIVLDVTSQPQEVIDTMNAAITPPTQ
jgi:tripartite-type tricarboxylate transporter receptor subunit TctC